MTAADVAFALVRLADPEVGSPVIDTFARLAGFRDFAARLQTLRDATPPSPRAASTSSTRTAGGIAGVRVLEPDRARDRARREPYPQILYWFAMPFTAPMPWEAVAIYDGRDGRDALADHPVGAGPFRLARYDRLSRIVLERNENWYGVRHPEWRAPGAVYPSEGEPDDAADGPARPGDASAGRCRSSIASSCAATRRRCRPSSSSCRATTTPRRSSRRASTASCTTAP